MIEELVLIDKRIDASDTESIRESWDFGRLLLEARAGRKQLPTGFMAAVCNRTGKSRSELGYRMQLAERYTSGQLSKALETPPSWSNDQDTQEEKVHHPTEAETPHPENLGHDPLRERRQGAHTGYSPGADEGVASR